MVEQRSQNVPGRFINIGTNLCFARDRNMFWFETRSIILGESARHNRKNARAWSGQTCWEGIFRHRSKMLWKLKCRIDTNQVHGYHIIINSTWDRPEARCTGSTHNRTIIKFKSEKIRRPFPSTVCTIWDFQVFSASPFLFISFSF